MSMLFKQLCDRNPQHSNGFSDGIDNVRRRFQIVAHQDTQITLWGGKLICSLFVEQPC